MRCIARIDGPNPCRFRSQPYSFVVVLLLNISKSIVKERNYVFSYPVVVEGHMASWDHVESKLACLIQSLQTDKVFLVELSFGGTGQHLFHPAQRNQNDCFQPEPRWPQLPISSLQSYQAAPFFPCRATLFPQFHC